MFKGIILLGGTGSRFDEEVPKQFHRLSGKKVYLHTLDVFLRVGFFDEVILVTHSDWVDSVRDEVEHLKNVRVIAGGSTRQESSYLGIKACEGAEYLVIHDAVRPFITDKILFDNKERVEVFGAVDTCIPSFDTVVECKEGDFITTIPQRSHYLRGQTPQSFKYEWILDAHEKSKTKNASDDCQLVMAQGRKVYVVSGCEHNIKLTTKLDLFVAEQLMRMRTVELSKQQVSLKDKIYVIVGGTGGIGSAIETVLKREGARTFLISKSLTHDITDEEGIKKIFDCIGPVDGLINAAGSLKRGSLEILNSKEIHDQLSINLHGVINTCKSAQIKAGGHIVNIASSSYSRGRKDTPIYSAAKAGVVNFTQAIAEDKPHLCINVVVPQRTNTQMRKQNFPEENESDLLSPVCVAEVVANLLRESSLTGQIIEVK